MLISDVLPAHDGAPI